MNTFTRYIKSHSVLVGTIVIVAVAGTAIAGRVASEANKIASTESNIKKVTLVAVSTFRTGTSAVSADGVVESLSQADLKSQLGAPVSQVHVSIGDTVATGQVLVELQNADIRAQLDQARASLNLAQGQYSTGNISLDSTRKATIDKIRDSYIKADDAIHSQIDQILYSSTESAPRLSTYIADVYVNERMRDRRNQIESDFKEWKTAVDGLSASSTQGRIEDTLGMSERNLQNISALLNDISESINTLAQNAPSSLIAQLNGWKVLVSSARNSISGSSAALTAGQASLSGAQASQESPAEAQISIATAGVKNLEAQLAKTIIRAPIAGKIAALPLRTGELASPGQLIATIVGGGGLRVKAYASGEDFALIKKGAAVMIRGTIPGTVANVAPSVNQDNKKVEVDIRITNPATSNLVVGENVQASIETAKAALAAGSIVEYRLPIQNIKIVPGDAYVLTVGPDSKIIKNTVTLGEVKGDFIVVKSGLTDDMKIISPIYELNEGETVHIQ